jgi:hypothetical protein
MNTRNTKYIIYAITPDDDVNFVIKNCKRPAACKEYKQYEKDFDLGKYDAFGYRSLLNLVKRNYWLTADVCLDEKEVKKYLK